LVTTCGPYVEKTIRTVGVYVVITLLLRLVGKRDLAQLNTFDLVVMLLLSNVVQNAIIGPDNSLIGGLYGAAVLLATNSLVVHAAGRWDAVGRLFEGTPTVLARNGAYDRGALNRMGLRRADVDVAIKHQGGDRIEDTSRVSLEPGGRLLVELNPGDETADRKDIDTVLARLDALEARLFDQPGKSR
jgi:uncharacterized membrane protein YcaP (DUF421 family)